jgi:hypothetical protein
MTKSELIDYLIENQRQSIISLRNALNLSDEWQNMYNQNKAESDRIINELTLMLERSIEANRDLLNNLNERDLKIATYETINLN